jgi:hypothetical protein
MPASLCAIRGATSQHCASLLITAQLTARSNRRHRAIPRRYVQANW